MHELSTISNTDAADATGDTTGRIQQLGKIVAKLRGNITELMIDIQKMKD